MKKSLPFDKPLFLKKALTPKQRAERNIAWIEAHCRIPEGRDVGKPVNLRDFQKKIIRKIYGNTTPYGTRRAIISLGRKNAKTALSAFLLLLHLCGPEARQNSQLFSTAQSRDQAALLFALASKCVLMSPQLKPFILPRENAKQLFCAGKGTLYRALSADATTAYGLSPAFCVHDELGQVRGPRSDLYDAMETATAAQEDPLSIIISTQAPTDSDLLSVLIDDALRGEDPRTVVELFTAPMEDDPFIEATIKKANPAFDEFMNRREVLAMAADAKRMPARESEYRNLVLNQRVEYLSPFVSRSSWEACDGQVADLHGIPLYAGLDLSSVSDLTAFVLMGWKNGAWNIQPTFWLPSNGLRDKSQADRVPYDLWHEQGYLQTTPGATVEYKYVAAFLFQMFKEYSIMKVGFDRWNMKHLKPWLIQAGFSEQMVTDKFEEFGQGTQSMSPALRDLEAVIIGKQIVHGGHPVLTSCVVNAVVEGKDDANRKLSKSKSTKRIDGAVALAMAMGVAPLQVRKFDVDALIG